MSIPLTVLYFVYTTASTLCALTTLVVLARLVRPKAR